MEGQKVWELIIHHYPSSVLRDLIFSQLCIISLFFFLSSLCKCMLSVNKTTVQRVTISTNGFSLSKRCSLLSCHFPKDASSHKQIIFPVIRKRPVHLLVVCFMNFLTIFGKSGGKKKKKACGHPKCFADDKPALRSPLFSCRSNMALICS